MMNLLPRKQYLDLIRGKNCSEVLDYAIGCVDGSINANEYRIKACERFLKDLENDQWYFNPHDADFVINICEKTLCHMQGEKQDGTPLRDTPYLWQAWQKFCVYNILGFHNKGTMIKRFHEALIFVPRKSSKTSWMAGFAFGLGLLYRKSGTKIYVVAAALKQTMETFDFLKYNVKRMGEDMDSGGPIKISDNNHEHSLRFDIPGNGMFELYALPTNPDAQDSFNCNIAIADEIHAFKKPKQYNLFKEAQKAYSNKLMIGISTAGDDPNSFLANRVKYCKKVLDGQIKDDQYFIFIAEADMSTADDGSKYLDFLNPKVHEMANPSYGISVRPEDLMSDAIQAQYDPQQRKDFFAKSLNVFTNQIDTYFDINRVVASDQKYNWTLEQLAKLPVQWYGGADLSKMHDLTGACLYGRYNGVDIAITHAFIPVSTVAEKADDDNIPVYWWKEMGWLTMCNSDIIEYEDVVQWFVQMRDMGFKIRWVGYDRRYSREFVLKMKNAGFRMVDQMQRYVEKTEAFREIEKKILSGLFYYTHNGAYEYCISNVKAVEDSDEFVRYQKVMPTQRIDLFDASVIACKQLLIAGERSKSAQAYIDW